MEWKTNPVPLPMQALQRKVHDHLTDLESINKQYRRLAKEGRTDNKGVLRSMMQEANDRWDALQQRVTDMMQGLRHSASIREDFLNTRLSLMQWLTEVDMQITNIEHLSQLDIPTKIKEIEVWLPAVSKLNISTKVREILVWLPVSKLNLSTKIRELLVWLPMVSKLNIYTKIGEIQV